MKSKRLKYAIWGAVIFGGIHLALDCWIEIKGGEALMCQMFLDYPLCYFAETVLNKVIPKPIEFAVTFYYLFFGTIMYAIAGSVLGLLTYKIKKK